MAYPKTIYADQLETARGIRANVTGYQYPDDATQRNFLVLGFDMEAFGMEFRVFLTPDECGLLAERLMSTKQAVEATGSEP
jgi:hypothetical protein